MAAVTTDQEIIVDRDYTDNFSIKDTTLKKLGPKYFEDVELSGLNIGALGFTLEQIANITEDAFNTSSILINEAFPNKAIIPESIYSHASIFQIDGTFRRCARCSFVIMLEQEQVLKFGKTSGNKTTFYLDKRTIITVEDIPFTLDYDIKIEAQKKQISGADVEYSFSAQYVIDSKNSISDVNDPYLKIRKTGNGYLLLQCTANQVERLELEDTIINNTKINCAILDFAFEGHLAGFDIFYKSPKDENYMQLPKKMKFSLPDKTPFCYYCLKDETTLEISFTTRDGYFQPDFNSDIKIVMYLTKGKEGNFDMYNGSKITFQMNSEKYLYNETLTIAGMCASESSGGGDGLSLEGLQALTTEGFATANELSTEQDLMTYFYNYKYRYGNEILVLKRRDDLKERLFSAFLLMKNEDYIYPTNTLYVDLLKDDFDMEQDDNKYTIKPGHCFVYKEGSPDTVEIVHDVMSYEKEKVDKLMEQYPFVYTNPFLISVTKKPNLVGIYQTIVNQTSTLDFISSDTNSFTQFITSKVNIKRGLSDKQEYEMSLSLIPSSSIDEYIDNLNDYKGNDVRVIAGFIGNNKREVGYIELFPTKIDENDKLNVTFSATITTNDYVTNNGQFTLLNAVSVDEKMQHAFIPIADVTVNIYILYYDALTEQNKFSPYFDDMKYYGLVNTYSTSNDPLTFIKPLNMVRSSVLFENIADEEEEPIINTNLSLIPMVKPTIVHDTDSFDMFINKLSLNYEYIEECLPMLRNNTHIDIKFYNTYGKSKNYFIGDDQELIDRVNIQIKFKITLVDGADSIEVRQGLRDFIKEFVEKVNSSGSNDLYISNLIKSVENNFAAVHHMRFMGINEYGTDYQTISVRETDLNELTKSERTRYVPEILVADRENILLSIFTN